MFLRTTVKAKNTRSAAALLLASMALTALAGIYPTKALSQPTQQQPSGMPGQMPNGIPGIPNGGVPMPPGGGFAGGIGGGGSVGGGGGGMPPGIPGTPSGPSPLGMHQPGVLNSPAQSQPIPLPPGDGPQPWRVEPGDEIAPLPPPTGSAGKGSGTGLYTYQGKDRTEVMVYVNNAMALVIRPDQLSQWQIEKINSILKINMLSGQQQIKVAANEKQIEEIQEQVLNPYPKYKLDSKSRPVVEYDPQTGQSKLVMRSYDLKSLPMLSGNSRQNQVGKGQEKQSLYDFDGPLPVIRPMCRWLILIGMVAATIWVATGSLSVVLGHPMAGVRVAQTFMGIGLLLCAYTIYKIVILNMMHMNSDVISSSLHRPNDALVQDRFVQPASSPPIPYQTPIGPARQGLPVAPLAEPYNP